MSFSIAVWKPSRLGGMPTTLDQVAEQYGVGLVTPAKDIHAHVSFAAQVNSMFRFNRKFPDEWREHFADFVAEARRDAKYEVWEFAPPSSDVMSALRLIASVAGSFDMLVYVDGLAMAILPGMKVLGLKPASPSVPAKTKPYTLPINKAECTAYLNQALLRMLTPYGFEEREYLEELMPSRPCAIGQQLLSLSAFNERRYEPGFVLSLVYYMHIPDMKAVFEQAGCSVIADYGDFLFDLTEFPSIKALLREMNTDDDLNVLFEHIKNDILPIVNVNSSYAALNELVNLHDGWVRSSVYTKRSVVRALVLAYLAKSDAYDAIEQAIIPCALQFFKSDFFDKDRAAFLVLVDYLRQQKALEGW